jgi:hypothetical protein
MKSGFILLAVAALLVAMLVPAFAVTADNGVFAPALSGTKINVQEEVGGILSAENMIALAVVPNDTVVASPIAMNDSVAAYYDSKVATPGYLYNITGSALGGGDGLLARRSKQTA